MNLKIKRWLLIIGLASPAGLMLNAGKNSPPQPFQVTKARLSAMPADYAGPCPAEIKFKAKITVTGRKGSVVFQILRSDNIPAPSVMMHFNEQGTKDTTYTWKPEESFLGWHQLVVLQPNEIKSNQAEVAVTCQ